MSTMREGENEGNERVLKALEDRAAEAERRLRTLEQGDLFCTARFAQKQALVISPPAVAAFDGHSKRRCSKCYCSA